MVRMDTSIDENVIAGLVKAVNEKFGTNYSVTDFLWLQAMNDVDVDSGDNSEDVKSKLSAGIDNAIEGMAVAGDKIVNALTGEDTDRVMQLRDNFIELFSRKLYDGVTKQA